MEQPVVAKDGHTYDEAAIREWVRRHSTSPATRARLRDGEWFVNYRLKQEIGEWKTAREAAAAGGGASAEALGRSRSGEYREEISNLQRRIEEMEARMAVVPVAEPVIPPRADDPPAWPAASPAVSPGGTFGGSAGGSTPAGSSAKAAVPATSSASGSSRPPVHARTRPTPSGTVHAYSLVVLGALGVPGAPGGDAPGRFFQFDAVDLVGVVGEWDMRVPNDAPVHVKGGKGGTFRVRNQRTGKVAGVVVWAGWTPGKGAPAEAPGDSLGCWNPAEYNQTGDWAPGDVLDFLDWTEFVDKGREAGGLARPAKLPVRSHTLKTGTGWNIPGSEVAFGHCGIVGDWWKALEVEFEFEGDCLLTGVRTDSMELPYSVEVEVDGAWALHGSDLLGDIDLTPVNCTRARVRWESTDMHKSSGLSSMRSGGGFHCEFTGIVLSDGPSKGGVKGKGKAKA